MLEDLKVPESTDVYIIAVNEWNDDKAYQQWDIFLVNLKEEPIETVLILSRGYSDTHKSSILRHGLGDIPAGDKRKVEMIEDQVFVLTNEYLVTYFYEGKMIEKTFSFPPNSIKVKNQIKLKDSEYKGVIAE
ncbi:MAG TPA: hypothetical protein VKX30_02930 [Flavobacteriaceae bacterium]|nr:hypothetical protein [Flavobacteriaceae bacterium]